MGRVVAVHRWRPAVPARRRCDAHRRRGAAGRLSRFGARRAAAGGPARGVLPACPAARERRGGVAAAERPRARRRTEAALRIRRKRTGGRALRRAAPPVAGLLRRRAYRGRPALAVRREAEGAARARQPGGAGRPGLVRGRGHRCRRPRGQQRRGPAHRRAAALVAATSPAAAGHQPAHRRSGAAGAARCTAARADRRRQGCGQRRTVAPVSRPGGCPPAGDLRPACRTGGRRCVVPRPAAGAPAGTAGCRACVAPGTVQRGRGHAVHGAGRVFVADPAGPVHVACLPRRRAVTASRRRAAAPATGGAAGGADGTPGAGGGGFLAVLRRRRTAVVVWRLAPS